MKLDEIRSVLFLSRSHSQRELKIKVCLFVSLCNFSFSLNIKMQSAARRIEFHDGMRMKIRWLHKTALSTILLENRTENKFKFKWGAADITNNKATQQNGCWQSNLKFNSWNACNLSICLFQNHPLWSNMHILNIVFGLICNRLSSYMFMLYNGYNLLTCSIHLARLI